MSTRTTILLVMALIVAVSLIGILLWNPLPDSMASHWNVYDQVDDHMSKFWEVFLMPILSLVMFLFFLLIPNIDPLKANIAKFRTAFNLFILLLILFLSYLWTLSILWNLGFTYFKMSMALLPALGLLFMYMGYLLRKAKRNWFIGIRTPWTLSSDRVWDQSHRIGSILFFVSGALALIGSLFGSMAVWFILVPILGSTLFLVVYSYILYRGETRA
jgi:uncharacterized membrane protein